MTERFSGAETVSVEKLEEEDYPQSLRQLYDKNVEARQFVLDYKNKKDVHDKIDVSNEVTSGEIPLFIQWDERWGYEQYGDDFLAVTGCGPTSLSMVYIGLTGDTSLHPLAMARLAEKEGYYVNGSGSSWSMMTDLAKKLGLTVRNVVFDEGHILDELRDGNPIICIMGPGDFTTAGHFIVLTGIADNGEIEIHDPNSIRNSDRTWRLDVLMRQTRNLWGYSG
ncbi:MAG: C39 family peptidase [Lachnospiraceae bacterium]|nr:C39 family peptidase [Lachnospiraceae bacterium]